MSNFDKAIDRVFKHEGGYSNHASDPGGATQFGITQATLNTARARGVLLLPTQVQSLSRGQAKMIYNELYWEEFKCNLLSDPLAFQLLDAVVNHNGRTAVRWLQGAVGAVADGVIGPRTLEAIGKRDDLRTGVAFLQQRLDYYNDLSTFKTFGAGWTQRLADNMGYLLEDTR